MKNTTRKALSIMLTVSVGLALTGCGKNTAAEESMQAELESLRAQVAAQETAQASETEAAETVTESIEETEVMEETEETQELRSWNLPFTLADGSTNLSLGQIAGGGDFYFSVVGVRVLDDIESQVIGIFQYDLPVVEAGKEVVYPIIQVYNASGQAQSLYQEDIVSLYADSVQVSPINLDGGYFSLDGVNGFYSYMIDPGHSAEIVYPFIVDEGWSEITVFCADASWTFTQDDVSSEPYEFVSVFNQNKTYEYDEPGSVVYREFDYELILDGIEVDTTSYTRNIAVFEFTINNLTDEMLVLELPGYMRGYCNDRLVHSISTLQDEYDGHTNAYLDELYSDDQIEIHPGMSSRFYIAYLDVSESGTFECFFETDDYGVVARVCAQVQ